MKLPGIFLASRWTPTWGRWILSSRIRPTAGSWSALGSDLGYFLTISFPRRELVIFPNPRVRYSELWGLLRQDPQGSEYLTLGLGTAQLCFGLVSRECVPRDRDANRFALYR